MIETHPFGPFVPPNAKYFLLGSFTTKEAYNENKAKYQWFYANGRNQFWPILQEVYGRSLKTRIEMEQLFTDLHMALGDIILSCERQKNSNLDVNLTSITYAVDDITKILAGNTITKIFFTSRGVEDKFRRVFKDLMLKYPNIELVTLPSPSPRFTMKLTNKIQLYKDLLPTNCHD